MNREPFANGEYYHVYNRGTDKRQIFLSKYDLDRFLLAMKSFNSVRPIGSLWQLSSSDEPDDVQKRLVEIVAYCLNPNHFHLVLKQLEDGGISEFMKRLDGGYTWYFNYRNKRSGALFQGRFKSRYIPDDDYFMHVVAYVNLNDRVHQLKGRISNLVRSSWVEYVGGRGNLCSKETVMDRFDGDKKSYESFAKDALVAMLKRKQDEKFASSLLIEEDE